METTQSTGVQGDFSESLDELITMFGHVMHSDAIQDVFESCNGNMSKSVEIMLKIVNSEPEVNAAPSDSYAKAAKDMGAIPKQNNSQPQKIKNAVIHTWTDQLQRIIEYHNKGYRVLIIMRGVPGTGKSYLARQIIEMTIGVGNNQFRTHVCSTDDFFSLNGRYRFNPSILSDAHSWNQKRVQAALMQGLSPVIVDNTNIELWEMQPYVKFGTSCGYLIELVTPNTTWAGNANQLAKRNLHNIDRVKIKRMMDSFQSRDITGEEYLRYCGLSYPSDKIPPVMRAIPIFIKPVGSGDVNESVNLNSSSSIADENAKKQEEDSQSIVENGIIESMPSCSSGSVVINQKNNAEVKNTMKEFEKLEQEWEMGDDWSENSHISNRSNLLQPNQDLGPKPQRNNVLKTTQQKSPESALTNVDEDWSKITSFMPTWDQVTPKPKKYSPKSVTTTSASTCQEYGDFKNEGDLFKVIQTKPRDINFSFTPRQEKIPDKRMLDKSSMTNDQDQVIAETCICKNKNFSELRKMFKNIAKADLKEIFNTCNGDINWAAEIIMDGSISNQIGTFDEDEESDTDDICQDICKCTTAQNSMQNIFSSPPTPTNLEQPEAIPSQTIVTKKTKKDKTQSESSVLLKRQIENNVTISSNHYSQHCLKIRKMRRGETDDDNTEDVKDDSKPGTFKYCISASNDDPNSDDDLYSSQDAETETVNITLGADLLKQLDEHFDRKNVSYPENIVPMISIPLSTLNQINALWVESLTNQIESQTAYSDILKKEDEEFARKLAEQEAEFEKEGKEPVIPNLKEIMDLDLALSLHQRDVDQWKNNEPNDMAARMTRDKLNNLFPELAPNILSEVLMAHNYDFQATVEVLLMSTGQTKILEEKDGVNKFVMVKEMERQMKILENEKLKKLDDEEWPLLSTNVKVDMETVQQYRNKARKFLERRNMNYQRAQDAYRQGLSSIASYYSEVAALQKRQYEHANSQAANALIQVNASNSSNTTLDLHYLYVAEALVTLDLFLDHHIQHLRLHPRDKAETVFLITGRGLHSPGGPRVKPAVKLRLRQRGLASMMLNPGLLSCLVQDTNILTHEIQP